MTATELAEKLEAWAQGRREAAIYHDKNGNFAISGACETEEDRLRQAAARLRSMAEALKPFARSRERDWDEDAPDDTEVWNSQGPGWGTERTCLTVGDFSKARAALSGEGQ